MIALINTNPEKYNKSFLRMLFSKDEEDKFYLCYRKDNINQIITFISFDSFIPYYDGFTKMKGMFEGKETFLEGLEHLNMPELVASVPNLKIFYLFGADDRLLKQEKSTAILKEMLKVNPNIEYYKMTQENSHGYPDHCLWSPQCSDLFLRIAMNFYHNVITKQDNYTQVRKK